MAKGKSLKNVCFKEKNLIIEPAADGHVVFSEVDDDGLFIVGKRKIAKLQVEVISITPKKSKKPRKRLKS